MFELPAGDLSFVLGAEYRGFEYDFNPGAAAGPISGPNTQNPDAGTNSFKDIFGELLIPIARDVPFANSVELSLGARYSKSEFADKISGFSRESRGSWAYKAELNWEVNPYLRTRASYQQSVREPNFGELFAGGGSQFSGNIVKIRRNPNRYDRQRCGRFAVDAQRNGYCGESLNDLILADGIPPLKCVPRSIAERCAMKHGTMLIRGQ